MSKDVYWCTKYLVMGVWNIWEWVYEICRNGCMEYMGMGVWNIREWVYELLYLGMGVWEWVYEISGNGCMEFSGPDMERALAILNQKPYPGLFQKLPSLAKVYIIHVCTTHFKES